MSNKMAAYRQPILLKMHFKRMNFWEKKSNFVIYPNFINFPIFCKKNLTLMVEDIFEK